MAQFRLRITASNYIPILTIVNLSLCTYMPHLCVLPKKLTVIVIDVIAITILRY
jgi:hypothetical protein